MRPALDYDEESYAGLGHLLGRKALITCGDSGIGREATVAFAREGTDVAINYLPSEEHDAEEVLSYIKKAGTKGVALPGAVSDEDVCRSLIINAVVQLGGLDVMVINAARHQARSSVAEVSSEDFDRP